jgi:hypothetical protein
MVQRLAGFVRDKFDNGRVIDETWKRAPLPAHETVRSPESIRLIRVIRGRLQKTTRLACGRGPRR